MEISLTFDDIALVPQYNNIKSRTEPNLETWLTKDIKVDMPLIPANMDTVIGPELADVIIKNGGVPIFHRFYPLETQQKWVQQYKNKIFISSGLNDFESTKFLLEEGALGVCIDIAHGHDKRVLEYIHSIKSVYPDKQIIAGNVCTPMAYQDLVNAGADAVKVGIGPGSACTTRIVTGFGYPEFSAIKKCSEIANKLRVPIIADGGIRGSADVVKALAAGASTVMSGKLFAMTNESAAPKDHGYAKYRGQASKDFQDDLKKGVKRGTVPEGVAFWEECGRSAQDVIDELLGGLRSGLTYGGARNINELQRKMEFVRVVPNSYSSESNPRMK